jgi:hypothetical protein
MVVASSHTWGDKVENGFQGFFDFIPNLIGFLAVLVIGYFVAKVLAHVIGRLLHRAGIDRTLTQGQGGRYVSKVTTSPARLLGRIVFWALMLGVVAIAVTVLGIEALTDVVGAIFAYLPNVLAALLIFLVAGAIAGGVAALAQRTMGETTTGKVVSTVAPVIIMAIAGFMILDQLKIAEDIVLITYVALMGGLALALALAFGLGGRDVAARMLEGAYVKGQESREQVRRDLEVGREQARRDLGRARGAAEDRVEGDTLAGPPRQTTVPEAGGVGLSTPDVTTTHRVERVGASEIDDVPPGTVEDVDVTRRRPSP